MYIRGAGLITITEDMYDKLLDEVKALKEENDELIKTRNDLYKTCEKQLLRIVEQNNEILDLKWKLEKQRAYHIKTYRKGRR